MASFENLDVVRLYLRAPLLYVEEKEAFPFVRPAAGRPGRIFPSRAEDNGAQGEYIFHFEIEEKRGNVIDPNPAGYLECPVFSGRRTESRETVPGRPGLELSEGVYFFAQAREALDREECTLMAIEVQRELLWQRLPPRKDLFIRRLFEHGKHVTQIWRTFTVRDAKTDLLTGS
ncbi:MAG: hypothetical protein LBI86_06930 [Treponema sp.]|jgi:hypothetical protein|nr:hypothetical protein [Treponema sp.]